MRNSTEPPPPDAQTSAMMARLQRILKPGVTILQATMRPDGTLDATLRLPDGRESSMSYVEVHTRRKQMAKTNTKSSADHGEQTP
jgi:hypothetical protein